MNTLVSPKEIFVTYMEVRRRHTEVGSKPMQPDNFQRQRSNNSAWLDFEADCGRYYSQISTPHQVAMERVYWNQEAIPQKATMLIVYADEGLERFYKLLPAELIAEGEKIAGKL